MRLNAYVLAADPAWIEPSVLSYYDYVARIVVSYDKSSVSWTGVQINVPECLERIRAIDRLGKCVFIPGSYARLDHRPMENETYQRQCALTVASRDADWVLQLDTDEVVSDPVVLTAAVRAAHNYGASAMNFPARELIGQLRRGRFLETSDRWWRLRATYPGPIAVRAGAILSSARHVDLPVFRVDFQPSGTDPLRRGDRVHQVIPVESAIVHYSWIRDDESMRRKSEWSGHAYDFDWTPRLQQWRRRRAHPWMTVALTPLRRNSHSMLRISYVPPPLGSDLMRAIRSGQR